MIRIVLYALTSALLLALAIITARWAVENFVPSPAPIVVPPDAPIRNLGFEVIAERALARFRALSPAERDVVTDNLRRSIRPLDAWVASLNGQTFEFICLGERHEETTRRFLAERLFPGLRIDVLMLEATRPELEGIVAEIQSGNVHVPLLQADIAAVILAARSLNRGLALAPIEEDSAQKSLRLDRGSGSRDDSITANFRSQFRPGKRHLALFGALHCTNQPGWLFTRVGASEHRMNGANMLNVNVLGNHQDGPLEAFLHLLTVLDIEHGDFVIPRTAALHPVVYEWFSSLTRTFGYYESVIVFDEDAIDDFRDPRGAIK